jgi:hypothetical protein
MISNGFTCTDPNDRRMFGAVGFGLSIRRSEPVQAVEPIISVNGSVPTIGKL